MANDVYIVTSESHNRPLVFGSLAPMLEWVKIIAENRIHGKRLNITIRVGDTV
jgi:hypothetical protein